VEKFLDLTAKKILSQYSPEALDKIAVVFPSRRAGVFFRRSLWEQAKRPFMLPGIFAMEDFVLKNTGLQQLDSISLSFELFEVHKTLSKEKASFDEFLKYGNTILKDFNELDMHLADIQKAFSYLEEYRELKLWGLEKDELSGFQKKYLEFYKSLSQYYDKFRKRLLTQKKTYQGLAFRELAENMDEHLKVVSWEKVFFAGFNALTPAEERIVEYFLKESRGEIIWNADKYYLDDKRQEAGQQMRKFFAKPHFSNGFVADNFQEKPKQVDIYGCPGDVAEVKLAGELLQDVSEDDDVAVVLADESLLEPLLNSIPENISAFNVTMGLPLGNTPLFSLFENLFRLHVSPYKTQKSKKTSQDKVFYYYKDVLRVMAHPLIKKYLGWLYGSSDQKNVSMINRVQEKNIAYYALSDLETFFRDAGIEDFSKIRFLWEDWRQDAGKALESFLELLKGLRDMIIGDTATQSDNQLLLEYIYRFSNVFQTMDNLHQEYGTLKDPNIFWRFLIQLINHETISFKGEPLKGIQIMGMLEARLLDFERVILISANEEFLPGGQHDVTLMPFEMRLNYHLPMKKDKAAIYAHHFYSLMQRAGKIDIIYNSVIEGNKGSDMSRFVKQIIYELPVYSSGNIIRQKNVALKPDLERQKQEVTVEKTEAVMALLRKKAETGFAATTLNKYRICPLKYYLEEILNIEEREEVEETIEARTLGNVMHDTLERLYENLKNKKITKDELERLKAKADNMLQTVFKEQYTGKDMFKGKNLLIYHVAKHWLEEFLKKEKADLALYDEKNTDYFFRGAEVQLDTYLTINQPEKNFKVKFKGKIDRVDEVGDTVRIIDYKTGKVNSTSLYIKDLDQLMDKPEKKEAFQLMSYQWLYRENYSRQGVLRPAIFSFPAYTNDYMTLKIADNSGSEQAMIDGFKDRVGRIMEEIFNKEIAFRQTEDIRNCRNCDFKDLCNRNY